MGFSKLALIFIFLLLQSDLLIPTRSTVTGRLATRGAGGGGGRRGSGFVGGGSGGGRAGGGRSGSTGKGWGNNGERINPSFIPGESTTSTHPYRYAMFPVLTGGHTEHYLHNQGASSGHTLNCTRPLSFLVLTMLIYLLLSQV
ncbi:hypothetical protein SLEP1_g7371 [Rubroshorea leprosula]|uniref:Uncharacterized protein n=1 Tax=Rubroshorea leprosula TaxID=152421 RepID=A0AAV5I2S3_9ROSI|nr:hypothetical protein SLEP1_g7371 [Rubroshorea leprosula]